MIWGVYYWFYFVICLVGGCCLWLLFDWLFALLDVWLVADCVGFDWFWVIVIVMVCGCVVGFGICFVAYSSAYRFLWLSLCLLFGLMCLFRFKVMSLCFGRGCCGYRLLLLLMLVMIVMYLWLIGVVVFYFVLFRLFWYFSLRWLIVLVFARYLDDFVLFNLLVVFCAVFALCLHCVCVVFVFLFCLCLLTIGFCLF